jgi:hypothetical protein
MSVEVANTFITRAMSQPSRSSSKPAHQKNDQADQQNQADGAPPKHGSPEIKPAATEQKEKNQHN